MLQSKIVEPEGNPASNLWAIGEAPGGTENKVGRPFVGPAGQYLDMGLRDAKVMRSSLFLTNIFNQQPPGNQVGYFFNDSKNMRLTPEGEMHVERLKRQILEWRPNCILALGRTAMYALTGYDGISKMRGSLLPLLWEHSIKVYPTYHPSFVMRLMQESGSIYGSAQRAVTGKGEGKAQNVYPTFVKDLVRAWEQADTDAWPDEDIIPVLPMSAAEAISWLHNIPSGSSVKVASDIETIMVPGLPVISRVGFSYDGKEAISIPFTWQGSLCWTLSDWADILIAISEVYLSGRKIIFQNGFFDLVVMGKILGVRLAEGAILDTMVQQHCAYPHLPKGLDYQVSVYTWHPYYKDDRKKVKAGFASDEQLSIYNAKDNAYTREIQPITERDIQFMGMEEGYQRTLSLYPSLLFMMLKGVRIDQVKLREIRRDLRERVSRAQSKINKYAGREINPKSPKQLQQLLYFDMQFPPQFAKGSSPKRLTTDRSALKKLNRMLGHPILDQIEKFRKYSKLLDTYGDLGMAEGEDRVYTTYDPTGTVTWRLSSYESALGSGLNLQNIPKRSTIGREFRKAFVADPGFEICAADLAQAEDRVVVWKAGDEEAIDNYIGGGDPHWQNAVRLFGLDPTLKYNSSDPEHYRLRNKISKHVKHAGNYGVGPFQLREMLITMADFWDYDVAACKQILEDQRKATPRVESWKAWVREEISSTRTLVTVLGRKRIFYGRITDDLFKKAYAFDPQSTVGELMCVIIRDLFEALVCENFHILLNVHDEVVVQWREGMADYFLPRMKRIMEKVIPVTDIYGVVRDMVIPVDFKVGPSWGHAKEVKVEEAGSERKTAIRLHNSGEGAIVGN